jgi:hypothetical protein
VMGAWPERKGWGKASKRPADRASWELADAAPWVPAFRARIAHRGPVDRVCARPCLSCRLLVRGRSGGHMTIGAGCACARAVNIGGLGRAARASRCARFLAAPVYESPAI